MRSVMLAGLVAVLGSVSVGMAWAQGDVVAERRAGLRDVGRTMEAFRDTLQARGDVKPLAPRVESMIGFFQGFAARFPANSGTPPLPQGTGEGQTRALAAIWSDRAGFDRALAGVTATLPALRDAAASGDLGATMRAAQATGAACGECHRPFRAR